ncbi:hypothetical protein ACU4GD_25055 [Cupriavidus basilensis]
MTAPLATSIRRPSLTRWLAACCPMQARMVQFDALADRLYRVARGRPPHETGKDVRLLIKGGTVEVDRSVLDRMAGPIEHLIRNAVVRGIRGRRRSAAPCAGKPAAGALTLEAQQEGNEVVLHFSSTPMRGGRGLARHPCAGHRAGTAVPGRRGGRCAAHGTDLLAPASARPIASPELAGRGVGMDVVRAETVAPGRAHRAGHAIRTRHPALTPCTCR